MKRLLLLMIPVILAGCETLAPRVEGPADMDAWREHHAWLASIDRWSLEGRAAISAHGEGWNASVDWQQDDETMQVRFAGPLGMGSASIAGTPEMLSVKTGDGEQFTTSDPETDLYWELGWTAPLDRMRFWVLGMPGPGDAPILEIDGAGRVQRLEQGAWTIEYTDHLLLDEGQALPRKIEMHREGVRIRLIIGKWTLD